MYCQKCGAPIHEGAKFCAKCGHEVGAPVVPVMEPATAGKRFINVLLDYIFAYIGAWIIVLIGVIIGFLVPAHAVVYAIFTIVAVLFYIFGYHIFFESIWQRTPAKWITGTKVVKNDGSKPKFLRILGRTLCRFIPFEAFSFLFGQNPVGWHDELSHTLVVPSEYTADDVQKIDLSKKGGNSKVAIVIAIVFGGLIVIGIVAGVILASLGVARAKADDAKIEAVLSSTRAQAELYNESNNGSYAGVCTSATGIAPLLHGLPQNGLVALSPYVCNDSDGAWAASVPLESTDKYSCVDSSGSAVTLDRQIALDIQTSCGAAAQ